MRPSLSAVAGLTVGHWTDPAGATGCTAVLGPGEGMRAAAAVRGRATGTRELDALDPRHLVGRADALLFTGGSAFGLGAADGVMRWLRERDRGFRVRPDLAIPIVPAAVIFDLGNTGRAPRWPGPQEGYRACEGAGEEIAEGSVGAGTGATVGKILGLDRAMKGGVGTWAAQEGVVVVSALVVVNAVGDVRGADGAVLAGARAPGGGFADAVRGLAAGTPPFGTGPGQNTTLAVIATNADLDRTALGGLAHAASDALARRITPYGTTFDGDVTFAVSTARVTAASPLQVEALAAEVVPVAVERAVRLARGTPGVPGLADAS
jgi:L-aminopeptidase/D-esterase-like protein